MGCNIKFYAIVKNSGENLLSFNIYPNIDGQLLRGILMAFCTISRSAFKEDLTKLTLESNSMLMETFQYHINTESMIKAIIFSNRNISYQKLTDFSSKVLKRFVESFQEKILKFDGNSSYFNDFKIWLKNQILETFPNEDDQYDDKLDNIFGKILDGDMSGLTDI